MTSADHANTVREALSWEALDPDPASWGGRRAEANAALAALLAQAEATQNIAPAVRLVLEKALRADMTQPPVTRAELRFALDLLPDSPSFFASVSGMEQLAAAEAERDAAVRQLAHAHDALRRIAATDTKEPA